MTRKLTRAWRQFRTWPQAAQVGAPLALGFVLLVLWPRPALAGEMVFRADGMVVRLQALACEVPQLTAALAGESDVPARKAVVTVRGAAIAACWGLKGAKVLIGDVTGAAGHIMADQFKEDVGV